MILKFTKNVWLGGKSCHTFFANLMLITFVYLSTVKLSTHKFSENVNIAKLFQFMKTI